MKRQLLRRGTLLSVLLIQSILIPQVSTTPINWATNRSTKSTRPFRMLVLGDSVMWGQGLATEHKFSYLIANWICEQRNNGICQNIQDVQIHVEAHSGAVIARPEKKQEQEKEERFLRRLSPLKFDGEVNFGYPSVGGQVELAQRYYEEKDIPLKEIDLILVNGGINDMGATRILLPGVGGNLKRFADEYCREAMERLLNQLARTFPNARIVVPGYFPLVSVCTPANTVVETIGYLVHHKNEKANSNGAIETAAPVPPCPLPDADNPGPVLRKLAKRSQDWTKASDAAFEAAVKRFNDTHSGIPLIGIRAQSAPPKASHRALFVAIAFGDQNAYAANNTFLWKLAPKPPTLSLECTEKDPIKNLMINDELQKERPCMCDKADRTSLAAGFQLFLQPFRPFNDIPCVRAAAFHPNQKGAERYSTVIIEELRNILLYTGWASAN